MTQEEVVVNGGRHYGTVLTSQGEAAIAAHILAGTKLEIAEIAAGDGGGVYYEPAANQTALVREVWRGGITACSINPLTPNTLDIKGIIPAESGGFTVREMGIFDKDGTLIGICNTPDVEKADLSSGAGGKLDLMMHLIVVNANAVQVLVRPSLDTVNWDELEEALISKQDKLEGAPGQVPVFGADGELEAQDFSSASTFSFASEDWGPPVSWSPEEPAEGEEPAAYDGAEGYEIAIAPEAHGRKSSDFGFHIFHLVNGRHTTNTWAAFETDVRFDADTNTIILWSDNPYSGKILFV